jgi:ABC-type uncharacterized transport system involved in gliding motility auxiliary subunit
MNALKKYAHLVLNVLGLLGCFAMLVAIGYHHNLRVDLTPTEVYTLSKHSQKILDGIRKPVKILAFTRREDPRTGFLNDLFWRMRLRQPLIETHSVDLNRNPALARQYRADSYGSVVVECGTRRKSFSNVREEILMAALLQVTRDYEKNVYMLSGHGEHDMADSDRNKGYTTFRNVLEQEFYHVKPLSLFGQDEIPKDAATIIIAGPRRDMLPEEALKLDRYLRAGGSLLVMVDPGDSPSMTAFLRRYRLDLSNAIVGDGDFRLAASEPLTARISEKARESSITSNLDSDPVFSLFGPIDALPGNTEEIDLLALLLTSKNSWAIPTRGGEIPQDLDLDAKRGDRKGPFAVGMSVAVKLANAPEPVGEDPTVPKAGRMIVYSDSDFANNFFIELLGNRDLLVNSVNWLALEDTLIGVRTERKVSGKEQFFVSSRQNYMVFMLGVVAAPALFLALGAAVFLRRRLS